MSDNFVVSVMNFNDFTPEELVGKTVLYDDGFGRSRITEIDRITKTCFGIAHNEVLFKLVNGYERGGNGFHQAKCVLVTEDEADGLRKEWTKKKKIKQLKEDIITQVEREGFAAPTLAQLEAAATALGLVKM